MNNRHFLNETLDFVIKDERIDNNTRTEKVKIILRDYALINQERDKINNFNNNVFERVNGGRQAAPLYPLLNMDAQLDNAVRSERLPVVRLLLEAGAKINHRAELLELLHIYDKNEETAKFCYDTLLSSFSFPGCGKRLTVQEIITKIEEKIKQSQSNDSSFLGGLFRDTAFSAAQIKIANDLIAKIMSYADSLKNPDELKGMVLTEFEIASKEFDKLAEAKFQKDGLGRISYDARGNTRFHATIKTLSNEIALSEVHSKLTLAERSTPVSRLVAPLQKKNNWVVDQFQRTKNHFLMDRLSSIVMEMPLDNETRVEKLKVILPYIAPVSRRLEELRALEKTIYDYHRNDNKDASIHSTPDAVISCGMNEILASGYSALSIAVYRQDLDAAKVLLDFGAAPNLGDGRGLFIAVVLNDTSMMQLLINAKINLNKIVALNLHSFDFFQMNRALSNRCYGKVSVHKQTALMLASSLGRQECVALLLENDAELELRSENFFSSRQQDTALDCAIQSKCFDVVCMLLNKGAKINKPIELLKLLNAQPDQENEMVKSCYRFLTASSFSSPAFSKKITMDEIISTISDKIKESKANDFGFLGLFRDAKFYNGQVAIAENLKSHIERYNSKITNPSELKGMVLLEFEVASNAFKDLLGDKLRVDGINGLEDASRFHDDSLGFAYDIATRFHIVMLNLWRDIRKCTVMPSAVKEMKNSIVEASVSDVRQVSKGGIFASARVASAPLPQHDSDNNTISDSYNAGL